MTPDQLAVERDRLFEGGRTPEQVECAQWAMREEIVAWLVQMHYDYEGEDVRAIFTTREAAIAKATALAKEYGGDAEVIRDMPDDWRCVAGGGEMWVEPFVVSPAKASAGVRAPQPQAPQAETLIPCERCRNTRGPCDCARGVTPHTEHTSPAEFCWCRSIGGAP